ncbi:MAG: single-stranded-DNA-specific exonuclease RecJ [Planctomycetota bacterium]
MPRPWRLRPTPPDAERTLARDAGVHQVVARVLANRGIADPELARTHLALRADLMHEPLLVPGMAAACERLSRAVDGGETILVHGDYDVDGVCGTALLVRLLRHVGANVRWHIPNRLVDGYSFGAHSVERARAEGASVVLSVDNGTSAFETIHELRELGIDTVVTDHHEAPLPHPEFGALPPAAAIVNPKLEPRTYPWPELCGTAVAFKLAWGLLKHRSGGERVDAAAKRLLESQMALAALATVCDVVPLRDENRVLVHYGLKALRHLPTAGLAALCEVAKLDGRTPTAEEVAFQIGPRINAAGRLGAADRAVELLLTDDGALARRIAGELDALNQERKLVEREVLREALAEAERFACPDEHPMLVLAGQGWHQGVVGIVAARLTERFARPALVIGLDGDRGRGSARTFGDVDVLGATRAADGHFERYGGHEQAAGCEIEASRVDAARDAINAALREKKERETHAAALLDIDCELPFAQMDEGLMRQLESPEPFGKENERPVFLSTDLRPRRRAAPRRPGRRALLAAPSRRGPHVLVRYGLRPGRAHRRASAPRRPCNVVYSPRWNTFRGATNLEIEALDFRCGLDAAPVS